MMEASAPPSIHRSHRPTFSAAFGRPSGLMQDFFRPSPKEPRQIPILPPRSRPLLPTISQDKQNPSRQTLLSHTFHATQERYPLPAHRRVNALGSCFDKRVGVEYRVWYSCFRLRLPHTWHQVGFTIYSKLTTKHSRTHWYTALHDRTGSIIIHGR